MPEEQLDELLERAVARLRERAPGSEAALERLLAGRRTAGRAPVRVAPRGLPRWPIPVALAAAAAVAVAVTFRSPEPAPAPVVAMKDSGTSPLVEVARDANWLVVPFGLDAPGAASVALVGDFNDWNPSATPLVERGARGQWTAAVSLPPGRHEYAFVVDGTQWLPDPNGPLAARNEFGTRSSVLYVGTGR